MNAHRSRDSSLQKNENQQRPSQRLMENSIGAQRPTPISAFPHSLSHYHAVFPSHIPTFSHLGCLFFSHSRLIEFTHKQNAPEQTQTISYWSFSRNFTLACYCSQCMSLNLLVLYFHKTTDRSCLPDYFYLLLYFGNRTKWFSNMHSSSYIFSMI